VIPFVVMHFSFGPKYILDPFSISTPMGDSVVARRFNRGCVVNVGVRETLVDLIELDVLDFDVILGMDWLHSCYASLDCRTRKIILKFPNKQVIKWEWSYLVPKERFISYIRARKLISKGYLYHLV